MQAIQLSPSSPGFGLGLSLVKQLAEHHHGNVYVDPKYDNGCSMCVDIPLIEVENATEAESSEANTLEDNEQGIIVTKRQPGQNILIVEDNVDMRNFITEIFSKEHNVMNA